MPRARPRAYACLAANPAEPVLRPVVDPDAGTIAWPNGVDLAPEPPYEEARRNLVESAPSPR
jgi:hypothetical protein